MNHTTYGSAQAWLGSGLLILFSFFVQVNQKNNLKLVTYTGQARVAHKCYKLAYAMPMSIIGAT